jgi:hypothetical protein
MIDNVLRRRWEPRSEAELLRAYNEGMLEERNWCDLKREIENTKGANKELARDLASFSIDGGTLIIGLDETEPEGNPLHPVPLANLAERIEQIALNRVDPPLTVVSTPIKSEADESEGYLLVHIPSSAMAPHQVGSIYYGRGDKTKRPLPDSEVQRLFSRRAQWTKGIEETLRSAVLSDPFKSNGIHGHLFLVAAPVGGWQDGFQVIMDEPSWKSNLQNIRRLVTEDEAMAKTLGAMFPGEPISSHFSQMFTTRKTAHGILLTSRGVNMPYDHPAEGGTLDLEVRENGEVRLFYGGAVRNRQGNGSEGQREPRLYLVPLVRIVREFIKAIVELSNMVGYAAMWDIGVTITDLKGAYGVGASQFGASSAYVWSDESYERTTRTSVTELEKMPALTTGRLIKSLLRAYSADTQFRPLLSD